MNNELAKYKEGDIVVSDTGGLLPRTFEGLWRMSQIMAASGLMPKGIDRPESVFVAVQFGLEIGLSPMQAVQNIAPINGRPTLWGDAMLGLVRGSGLLEEFKETSAGNYPNDNFTAVCTVKRQGADKVIQYFSIGDAKKAGLWGKSGPWTQYPKRMLQMRARSWALRDSFGDILKGLRCAEEVMDYDIDMRADETGAYNYTAPAQEEEQPAAEAESGAETESVTEAFDNWAQEQGCDAQKMGEFLSATAEANGMSVDDLKAQAMRHQDKFMASFNKYVSGNGGKGNGNGTKTKHQEEQPAAEQTGEQSPEEAWRAKWINLRSSGFRPFVKQFIDDFQKASLPLQQEAREKWNKFYPKETFPLDLPENAPEEEPKIEEDENGRPVNGNSPFARMDRLQNEDPDGFIEALQEAGFTNEPASPEGARKVLAAYDQLQQQPGGDEEKF